MDDPAALSRDGYLGGRLQLHQPRRGYRAGVDPVFLAASIRAQPGQQILDLGCGVGAAALCLGTRVAGLQLTGLERQPDHADLARRNASENGIEMRIYTGDLDHMPDPLRQQQFDHVMANPPYFLRDKSVSAQSHAREAAMGEDTPLHRWVHSAARRTRAGGYVTFIQRVERLPELLSAFDAHLGSLELKPLVPRPGRAPQLILLRGRKSGKAAFQMHAGMLMHQGEQHAGDAKDYTKQVEAILRHGGPLHFSLAC